MENKYYSIGRNNTWTNEPATIEEIANIIKKKNPNSILEFKPSRLQGDLTIWIDGYNTGNLFLNKKEQIKILKQKNLI